MRVLVMASPVPSHLLPLLPLLTAAREAGHELLLAAQPDLAETARAAGLPLVEVGSEQREIQTRLRDRAAGAEDADGSGGSRREPPWAALARRWQARVLDVLDPSLAVARSWRPDVVVADPLDYASLVAGGLVGVPVVHHRWGVDSLSTVGFDRVRAALRGICADRGLPGGLPGPDLVLDPCPPGLQHPEAAPARPIRFVADRSGTAPAWVAERTAPRRVCVTLGLRTVALEGSELPTRLATALGALPGVEVVVTVEPGLRDAFGPLPPSVRLVDPAPLGHVLGSCDAVVHHGGSGTGLAAVAEGLPQLVVPQIPWTAEHGERIAACTAGLTLADADAQRDPRRIAAAVGELLADPRYAEGAGRLRAELHRMPAPAEAVRVLEDLASGGAGTARPRVEAGSSRAAHSRVGRNG
ncbi:DUF1205 domain-containing protein [Streptacidiphilus sp. ASG 303]|uniref:nucleotide disphospho-sugar-binding domain-containing protein n=1 Tax=Streptacidiphilus sp. ASG 303 TaxID=2896847 RepID=UPI001E31B175|nr:nucleotide disphospho-sugar-binding domain-containing protein [Streptacidiphilus sp. ASG 303]MCD0485136.1 DUF1205 domain-containing protein [Streptacidiphilus sp. ASG 303]